ncbi:thiamine pyrophosphate-binding protein [Streptomyces hainanensis]|uniref:thiamine pyrophosphate-binding protein n=1 Tax=Streptomyces hainanensis TaxID=402648 RepID=UPI001404E8EC|nr:thiamine pyrophosphate-dependent enzyme [Streptomyces hainanensis]
MKAREALADALAAAGFDTVFALLGAANQDLLCDLQDRLGLRVVHGRHESAVVSMADGYARFTGRPAVATVTAGPGLTNTGTALAVARSHRSPVLLLAGDTPAGELRNPQHLRQDAFARALGCRTATLRRAADLPTVWRAARATLARGAPFVLNLPADVQQDRVPWRPGDEPPERRRPPRRPHATRVEAAARLLADARRVGILAGRGALAAGPALRELADALPAVLTTTLPANGLFAGHPHDAGVCGGLGDGRAGPALADCDTLLAVGTSLHPLSVPPLAPATTLLRVDRAAGDPADGPRPALTLHGDAAPTVRRLADLLGRDRRPGPSLRLPDRASPDPRPYQDTADTLDPRHALLALVPLLPPGHGVVVGGGHAALTACQSLPAPSPLAWTCVSTDFGAIGQALPVAVGACFARAGSRVVHVTGDGDLMMSLAELDTAVRYRLPLTVVVLNDQGFGQERHNLRRTAAGPGPADHPSPDLAALASAFGAAGHRIEGPTELAELHAAMAHREGPVLVDIRVNPAYRNPASEAVARALSHGGPAGRP